MAQKLSHKHAEAGPHKLKAHGKGLDGHGAGLKDHAKGLDGHGTSLKEHGAGLNGSTNRKAAKKGAGAKKK